MHVLRFSRTNYMCLKDWRPHCLLIRKTSSTLIFAFHLWCLATLLFKISAKKAEKKKKQQKDWAKSIAT